LPPPIRRSDDSDPDRFLAQRALELRHHLAVMKDRTGNQVWRVRDEEHVVQPVVADPATVAIDEVRDLGEREE